MQIIPGLAVDDAPAGEVRPSLVFVGAVGVVGSIPAQGNADDLLHTAEMLEKLDASLVDTYAKKTGCTPEEIAGWMKAETWFSAGESVERGFADRVAEAAPKAQADWNLSVYANAPVVPAAAASVNPQNRERYERTARLFAVTRH